MNTTATKTSVVVMLAVNDPQNGNFAGDCISVDISDVIRVGGDEAALPVAFVHDRSASANLGGVLVIETERYRYWNYRGWVGNWCWDAARMKVEDVAKLLEQLRSAHWTCVEAESALFDAWKTGEPLAPALAKAVSDGGGE